MEKAIAPDRLKPIIAEILKRRAETQGTTADRIADLQREQRSCDVRIDRLLHVLEDGGDASGRVRQRLVELEQRHREIVRSLEALSREAEAFRRSITPDAIERFAHAVKDKVLSKELHIVRPYLRSFISRVRVGRGRLKISGARTLLAKGVEGLENAPRVRTQ